MKVRPSLHGQGSKEACDEQDLDAYFSDHKMQPFANSIHRTIGNPMSYTLGQAAKATGKSKSTISKALKSGIISGEKGANGAFKIEPSELHRVFPANSIKEHSKAAENTTKEHLETAVKIAQLEVRLEAAEKRADDLEQDRDSWRNQANALLTDQRPKGLINRIFGR